MAVSKRLRFEVLRRDNNTCRYCGRSAPEVKLTIDHVVPESLGGSDDPRNLVAACVDCNSGKSSASPDAPLVANVADDALRWAAAMKQAAAELASADDAIEGILDVVADAWKPYYKPADWASSVVTFIKAGLSQDDLLAMVDVAYRKRGIDRNRWSYFCGCCWSRLREIQDRAQEIIGGAISPEEVPGPELTTAWPSAALDAHVASAEGYASRNLTQREIDSAHCLHREWGEGDCGDPLCRMSRAESLSWMADSVYLKKLRGVAVMDQLDELDEIEELEASNA